MAHNIYGGVAYLPEHKFSDMHGLVRCVIRGKGQKRVVEILGRYGVEVAPSDFGRTWFLSKSVVETQATSGHSHEPLVCPLPLAYLKVDYYEVLRRPQKEHADPGLMRVSLPDCRGKRKQNEFFGWEQ